MAYSEPPLRNMVRPIVTSAYSIGSAPSELSMVSSTSARPSGGRPDVPAKMTSSILPPRSDFAPCSPITHASASTTLDLPDPLGPTTQVIPGSSWSVVEEAKDLNPLRVRLFRYNGAPSAVGENSRRHGAAAGEAQRLHPTRRHPGTVNPGPPRARACPCPDLADFWSSRHPDRPVLGLPGPVNRHHQVIACVAATGSWPTTCLTGPAKAEKTAGYRDATRCGCLRARRYVIRTEHPPAPSV